MKLTEQECIDFIKSTNGTKFEPSEINEICAIMKEKFILEGSSLPAKGTLVRNLRRLIGKNTEEIDKYIDKDIVKEDKNYEYGYKIISDSKIGFKRTKRGKKIVGYWYEKKLGEIAETVDIPTFAKYLADSVTYSKILGPAIKREYYVALSKTFGQGAVKEARDFEEELFELNNSDIDGKIDEIDVMENVSKIQQAINKHKKIKFKLAFYDYINKKVKLNFGNQERCVSPFRIMMNNGRYYLMAFIGKNVKKFYYFRIDLMSEITVMDNEGSVKPVVEESNNPLKFIYSNPYFYSGKKETIVLGFKADQLTQIFDWFGATKDDDLNQNGLYEIQGEYKSENIKMLKIKFPNINVNAFSFWVMQYIECIEILEGAQLKKIVIERIETALKKLKKDKSE